MSFFDVFIFVIWLLTRLINLLVLFYEKFSFPLLFLVTILIFRKEISSLLKRVRQINVENNSSKISFLLSEMDSLKSEMDNSINFQIRQYGEDLRLKGQLGSGVENDEPTEIIQQIYDTAMDIKANGGYLFDQELVYNYRSFIELSYKGLGNRIEKE